MRRGDHLDVDELGRVLLVSGFEKVLVEDRGPDDGCDQSHGQCAGHQDDGLTGQEPGPRPVDEGLWVVVIPSHPVADASHGRDVAAGVGSSPSLRRRWATWTSTRCSSPTQSVPQMSSMSWRRVKAIVGRRASVMRRSRSVE